MKTLKNLYFIVILFSILSSCKKKPDANPCQGMHPTSADFKIEEKVGDRYFEGDTVNGLNFERFTTLYPADSFVWTLGSETIRGQSFSRYAFPPGTWVQVKCIAYKKPSYSCFPNDKPTDTVVKSFYVWPQVWLGPSQRPIGPQYPVFGGYRGHTESNPGINIVVRLQDTFEALPPRHDAWSDTLNTETYFIRNIPYNGIATDVIWPLNRDMFTAFSPKAVEINTGIIGYNAPNGTRTTTFPAMKGYAWLSTDWKNITIQYSYQDTLTQKWVDDTFTGIKLW